MTATNGAAERLLLFVEDELQPQFKSSGGYRDWQEAARRFFTNTFDAERRATVERIVDAIPTLEWIVLPDSIIDPFRAEGWPFDEEAAQ